MLDLVYWGAAIEAAEIGMPRDGVWALLWTPSDVPRGAGTTPVIFKLGNQPATDLSILSMKRRDLRMAAGWSFEMFGLCVQEDSPTAWAIPVPYTTGAYVLIEPWLTVVPIDQRGVVYRQRSPDGSVVKGSRIFDPEWVPDSAKIADAMRVLDMRVRPPGRPEVGPDPRLDRLARAGLKWMNGNRHRHYEIEDTGRRQWAEALGDDTTKRVNKSMERKPSIRDADVHRRMREIAESRTV